MNEFKQKLEETLNRLYKENKLSIDAYSELMEFADPNKALQLQQTGVSGTAWIEVLSGHEITEYSKKLEPIWVILEEDETKTPILCQPDGHDNYYGSDDIIYNYCDISHFMKIQRPVF